jgi:DNA-binding NtrC family response regulator
MCPAIVPSSRPAVTALLLGSFDSDRSLLRDVFRRYGWELMEASGLREGLTCVRDKSVQVVIASAEQARWTWQSLLERLRALPRSPQLIVTSRNADELLWAEVLNVGGYDVLAQPLDSDEVARVVASACRSTQLPRARTAMSS